MEQGKRITIDAHTLIWYLHSESNKKLSTKALATIKEAESYGIIYVPTVTLMEILILLEKGKYPINFDAMLQYLEESDSYQIVPLTTKIVKAIKGYQGNDLHDRVIVATAIMTDTDLVTKDMEIPKFYNRVIW